jgi:lysophospholipase L1-like esterase
MKERVSSCGFALLLGRALCGALALSALSNACASSKVPGLSAPRGSLVVFYGDSITRRGDESGGWVKLIRERVARDLRRPNIRLINAGRCGATAEELASMLQEEFPQRPQAAVVCIGVNNAVRRDYADPHALASYEAALTEVVSRLRKTGAEVIVVPPLLYGEGPRGSNARDAELDAYARTAALVAEKSGVHFVDARTAFFSSLEQIAASNGRRDALTVDGLHLSPAGNQVLADVVYGELVSLLSGADGRGAN